MIRDGEIAEIRQRLGMRIRYLREERGYSQYVFSDMTGINRSYLIEVEKGRRNIAIDNLIKISQGLGVQLSYLFQDVDRPA